LNKHIRDVKKYKRTSETNTRSVKKEVLIKVVNN